MVTKNDLLLLLTEMQEQGMNVDKEINKLLSTSGVSLDILKYVNSQRQFDVSNFYELIRKNYNAKKSPLYKNIVKEESYTPGEVLTTLAALNLQILLYANKLEDNRLFLKHSRAEEITRVLNNYYKTYDLIPCFKLIKLIKSDLKTFEGIK